MIDLDRYFCSRLSAHLPKIMPIVCERAMGPFRDAYPTLALLAVTAVDDPSRLVRVALLAWDGRTLTSAWVESSLVRRPATA
jgi:hypothetical protein